MIKHRLRAVLFGPQGSGKGTQGELLADRFDVPLIGAGELIRAEIMTKSHVGQLLHEYVKNGLLAPDDLVNAAITERLKKFDLSKGFILDGYPRNVEQAQHLDRIEKANLAIFLKISDRESLRRQIENVREQSQ
ncbi:MAG: nucleoside monophosphate kinase, partial [Patescibacteria group bacterium]